MSTPELEEITRRLDQHEAAIQEILNSIAANTPEAHEGSDSDSGPHFAPGTGKVMVW